MSNLSKKLISPEDLGKLVKKLYISAIRDEHLRPFFENVLKRPTGLLDLEQKQKNFLSLLLNDQEASMFDLQRAHQPLVKLGLSEKHFKLILEHLDSAMISLCIDNATRAEILLRMETTKQDVLGG